MKLTTKMIKQIIREEIEEASAKPSIETIAKKLGAPVEKEEEVTQEAFEHLAELTPEQMAMLKDGLMNLIQIAGGAGGLAIMLDKVAEEVGKMKKDKQED